MRRLRTCLVILVVIVLLLAGAGTGFAVITARRMLPQTSGVLSLKGLDGKVEVYRDASGIPHIYATTPRDLFFAQGVVHAQDRWWQMEFQRHTALGRIGELTGYNETVLRNDIFIRTSGWNRAAQRDLEAGQKANSPSLPILNAYADGVNAYIDGKSGPDLAVQYTLLSVRGINIPIEKWEPLHSIAWGKAMAWSLGDNLDHELSFAELYKKFGPDAQELVDKYLYPPYPFDKRQTIITADDLPIRTEPVTARLASAPVVAPGTDLSNVQTMLVGELSPEYGLLFGKGTGVGSNNWVISGKLTASGKPLLANDPHIANQMPAIWYENGLHCIQLSADCPYDVVGFSFVGAPGVITGHNSHIAWGVTNVGPDVQDLYIIKVDPQDDTKYEVDGKTEQMQIITETIKFGDKTPPKDIRVRVTRFGPIITDSPTHAKEYDKPLALRWTALTDNNDILGSVLALNRASDWQSFRQALTQWAVPAQNFVYADVDGNIGYQTPGLIPIRDKNHSGLTPVDGSTTLYDWKGYIPFENLPRTFNPARGYVVTANEALVPPEYYTQLAQAIGDKFGKDSNYTISHYWDYGYRGARIVEMIKAQDKHTVDTVKAIQGDNYNGSAAEVLPAVLKLDLGSDVPKDVLDWIGKWDYQDHMDSGPAALFNAFWAQLARKLWGDQLGYTPRTWSIMWGTRLLLDQPDHVWWDDVTTANKKETRDEILRSAFVDAYKDLVRQLGADYKTWKWGTLHTVSFVSNPLGASGIDLIEKFVNGGPVAVSGGTATVNNSTWSPENPYRTVNISSMRMIVDVGDFNNSKWIIPTGQSGHPTSPHYRDQMDRWRMIDYNTMLWDLTSVKKAAVETLTLQPK
jgi:penicillin amidase